MVGTLKSSNAKILDFSCAKDPIKSLGGYLSYNVDKNNEENFFNKIRKMKTKLKPLQNNQEERDLHVNK